MKLADLKNPVRFNWLADQGLRLDASPYLSGAYEDQKAPGTVARDATASRVDRWIMTAGSSTGRSSSRIYVTDPDYGIPFLAASDMLEADLTNLPCCFQKDAESSKLSTLKSSRE